MDSISHRLQAGSFEIYVIESEYAISTAYNVASASRGMFTAGFSLSFRPHPNAETPLSNPNPNIVAPR